MKKWPIDYIPKINAVSSVEFKGMKNRTKLKGFIHCIISCQVSCEKICVSPRGNISDKMHSMEQSYRKIFAASSILQHLFYIAKNIASCAL